MDNMQESRGVGEVCVFPLPFMCLSRLDFATLIVHVPLLLPLKGCILSVCDSGCVSMDDGGSTVKIDSVKCQAGKRGRDPKYNVRINSGGRTLFVPHTQETAEPFPAVRGFGDRGLVEFIVSCFGYHRVSLPCFLLVSCSSFSRVVWLSDWLSL
jgi:hypothetical protein